MATATRNPGMMAQPWGSAAPTAIPSLKEDPEYRNVFRRLGFYCTLAVVFLRYTRLHETLATSFSVNNRLLYVFSIPAIFSLLFSGGLRRVFTGRIAFFWTAFVVWMMLAIPTSVWKGDSVNVVFTYLRSEYAMMLLLAGLPMYWKECRMVVYTIGLSGIVNVGTSLVLSHDYGGRMGLESPMIGNPNDFAGHLLMVLPSVVFMVLFPPRMPMLRMLLRLTGGVSVAYGMYLILASGSRGALLAAIVVTLFALVRLRGKARFAIIGGLLTVGVLIIPFVSGKILSRLGSYSTTPRADDEAAQSGFLRKKMLIESLEATATHPILGVGPGQFGNYEGRVKEHSQEVVVAWSTAHNSYTQIAADNGVPGIVFYVCGMLTPIFTLQGMWKRARGKAALKEAATACFCISAGYVGFCVAIFFLNFGYLFYLPAMAGAVIAIQAAVEREFQFVTSTASEPSIPAFRPARTVLQPSVPSPVPVAGSTNSSNKFRFGRYR